MLVRILRLITALARSHAQLISSGSNNSRSYSYRWSSGSDELSLSHCSQFPAKKMCNIVPIVELAKSNIKCWAWSWASKPKKTQLSSWATETALTILRDRCKIFGGNGATVSFRIMSAEQDGGDDDDISPISAFLPEEQSDIGKLSLLHDDVRIELQHHYIRSINSTLVIRQLPSQGLSFQLWPAATTLVNLLDEQRSHPETSPLTPTLTALHDGSDCRTLKVLEIGSGTGLVGIAAAATLGAKVTVTDLLHVTPNLQFNVEANAEILAANGGCVQVAPLHWGEVNDAELIGREFDLILASDVVYHDHLYDPLLQTLRSFLLGGGNAKMVFLMAHLRRWKKESAFFKKARKLFEVEVLHTDPPPPGSRIGVVVYRFAARQSKKSAFRSANEG